MKVDFDGDFENLKIQTDLFRNFSYSPYSNFSVGAAVVATLKDKQKIVVYGTNVENASYGLTICAERSACSCSAVLKLVNKLAIMPLEWVVYGVSVLTFSP